MTKYVVTLDNTNLRFISFGNQKLESPSMQAWYDQLKKEYNGEIFLHKGWKRPHTNTFTTDPKYTQTYTRKHDAERAAKYFLSCFKNPDVQMKWALCLSVKKLQ